VITDLEVSRLGDPGTFEVVIGSRRIAAFARTYAEGSDEPFLIEGSGGTLELSIRNARAADILHSARFDRVEVRRLDASPSIPLAE
jgi:S-adenosylmethionine hydrolase